MTATPNDLQRIIECCICCDYLTDVRETPCCHQLFCQTCIQSWLATSNRTCPRCRATNLTNETLLHNVVIQRFVDNLQFDCPFKLEGCPAQIPRSDLLAHKNACSYSEEKLRHQRETKLKQLHQQLTKYRTSKARVTDESYLELARGFHEQKEYRVARECLQLIKNKTKLPEMIIVQAQIERDDNHYDLAFQLYGQALNQAKSIEERIAVLLAQGHLLLKKAQYNQAREIFHQALALLPADNMIQKRAEILNACGLVAKKCSEYDQAIRAYNEALEIVNAESELWSEIISNLADIHRKKGQYQEARDFYLKALKQMESLHGQNHPSIADIMNNLGMLLKKEGKYNEALDYLKQAIKISKHYYGAQNPSIGIYLTNIGDIYRKQGDFKKAEATYQEALIALEKGYGPDHIEVAEVLNSMGLVLKKRADYTGAEEYYKRAIRIVHQTFGQDQEHYKLGIYYNNLADLDRKRNRYDEALALYKRALTAIEKTLGPQHSEAADILHNIGQVHHQIEHYRESIEYIDRALEIIKKEFGDKHYKYGMFLNSLGLSYAMLDEYETAYGHLKQALQVLITSLGQDHIEVCDVYANLGDVCMKLVAECDQGKKSKAVDMNKGTKLEEAKKYYTQAQRIVQATFGPDHTKSKQFLSLLFIVDNYHSL